MWQHRIVVAVLAIVTLTGCTSEYAGKPLVVVSVLPQAYFVRRIAGELVDVEALIPPGANPATYEPTVRQMRAFTDASLYVKVGHPNFPFESAWLDRLLGEAPELPVVDCSRGIQRLPGDPHVWLSPAVARSIAAHLAESLGTLLPAQEDLLQANLQSLLADIDELDDELRRELGEHSGGKILVFHAAWGYFVREYGLIQVAIEQGHREPTAQQLETLIEEAREEGLSRIFMQPQFPRRSAELLAEEIGAEVVTIDPLAPDWLANLRRVGYSFKEALER